MRSLFIWKVTVDLRIWTLCRPRAGSWALCIYRVPVAASEHREKGTRRRQCWSASPFLDELSLVVRCVYFYMFFSEQTCFWFYSENIGNIFACAQTYLLCHFCRLHCIWVFLVIIYWNNLFLIKSRDMVHRPGEKSLRTLTVSWGEVPEVELLDWRGEWLFLRLPLATFLSGNAISVYTPTTSIWDVCSPITEQRESPTAFSPEMYSLWIRALRRLCSNGLTFYCGHLDSLLLCASTLPLSEKGGEAGEGGTQEPPPPSHFCQSLLSSIGFHVK